MENGENKEGQEYGENYKGTLKIKIKGDKGN